MEDRHRPERFSIRFAQVQGDFCDTDGTLRDGGTSKHLACGEGKVDCAKSLKLLRDGGFRGWIMVDEWEVPDPYDASIKCKRAIDQAWKV